MIRTILGLGFFSMLGLFALGFVFKIFGGFIALVIWLFVLALKIALIGGAAYLVIRVLSPNTARQLRSKFSGAPEY